MKLLNKVLSNGSTLTARFLFPPITLPISEFGEVVGESVATQHHFSTIVLVKESDEFMVFEFDKNLLDGLLAYRARYGSMLRFEILLSRDFNGMLLMTIGANKLDDAAEMKERSHTHASEYNSLYSAYQNKKNYKVFEMT